LGVLTLGNENGYHLYMSSVPEQFLSLSQEPVDAGFPEGRAVSRQLLGERGELVIEHNGREYRLRLTQNGKLILTA
jgi:hemin uptake protein HemP